MLKTAVKLETKELQKSLEEIVANEREAYFGYGCKDISNDVNNLVEKFDIKGNPSFDLSAFTARVAHLKSYETNSARWGTLLNQVEKSLAQDPMKSDAGNEPEAGEDEENGAAESGSEDDSSEATASGIIDDLTREYSRKREMDAYIMREVPKLPVVGPLLRIIVFVYDTANRALELLVQGLKWIAGILNLQNNIVWAIRVVAEIAWPFRVLVIFLTTVLNYSAWFWLLVLLPILRFIWDPIGRTFRFLRKSLGKSDGNDPDGNDGDPLPTND